MTILDPRRPSQEELDVFHGDDEAVEAGLFVVEPFQTLQPMRRLQLSSFGTLLAGALETELYDSESEVREHGLAVLCRALFNSNEFLFMP